MASLLNIISTNVASKEPLTRSLKLLLLKMNHQKRGLTSLLVQVCFFLHFLQKLIFIVPRHPFMPSNGDTVPPTILEAHRVLPVGMIYPILHSNSIDSLLIYRLVFVERHASGGIRWYREYALVLERWIAKDLGYGSCIWRNLSPSDDHDCVAASPFGEKSLFYGWSLPLFLSWLVLPLFSVLEKEKKELIHC